VVDRERAPVLVLDGELVDVEGRVAAGLVEEAVWGCDGVGGVYGFGAAVDCDADEAAGGTAGAVEEDC
jgi:hypothetical protein